MEKGFFPHRTLNASQNLKEVKARCLHNADIPRSVWVQGKLMAIQHFESITLAIIPINFQRYHSYRKWSDILNFKVLRNR